MPPRSPTLRARSRRSRCSSTTRSSSSATATSRPRRWRRLLPVAIGLAFAVATFAYFLPQIADYRDVWDVIQDLSWTWLAALAGVTALNLLTFAPPWMVALPGLGFRLALALTQVSTALAIVVPAGAAVGIPRGHGGAQRRGVFRPPNRRPPPPP